MDSTKYLYDIEPNEIKNKPYIDALNIKLNSSIKLAQRLEEIYADMLEESDYDDLYELRKRIYKV